MHNDTVNGPVGSRHSDGSHGRHALLKRAIATAVVAAALLAVFAAYLRPDVAMTLANQLWNCF
jgi:hypothetical protein